MKSNISALPESELVNLMKQKDPGGLEVLYDKYAPALYGIILTTTADKQIAITILQAAFSKIWESTDNYNPSKMRLFTWMYKITCCVARNYHVVLTDNVFNKSNYTTYVRTNFS